MALYFTESLRRSTEQVGKPRFIRMNNELDKLKKEAGAASADSPSIDTGLDYSYDELDNLGV
jgi:hypothetical protein